MPNYYNPYNLYPVSYANQMGYNMAPMVPQIPMGQQAFAPASQQQDDMKWVEGELGAKMFQMPPNWPANKVIMLWDSTDTNIFLKSWGPMGIPNPIQKLHYTMDTAQSEPQKLPNNVSETSAAPMPDMSQYVTKSDLDKVIAEIRSLSNNKTYSHNNQNNQNGSKDNRGDNR